VGLRSGEFETPTPSQIQKRPRGFNSLIVGKNVGNLIGGMKKWPVGLTFGGDGGKVTPCNASDDLD
jgi:hypothetical protein